MRKNLKQKLTVSLLLTALSVMAIVSVSLLLGMARYSSAQFEDDVASVLTADLLSEMNTGATDTAENASYQVEQILQAYAGQLRLGVDRTYSIWDATTGEQLAGAEDAVMTDNIVTAMQGDVGDHFSLLPTGIDVAVPITGDVSLVLDIVDNGSDMRSMFTMLALFLGVSLVLSLMMCLILSRIFAGAFADAAVEAANELRKSNDHSQYADGDWEAMASVLYIPEKSRKKNEEESLQLVLPFLREGYVQFNLEGKILEINQAAETMLGVSVQEKETLTFENVFAGVPMLKENQSMVRGRFQQNGHMLEVTFVALEPDEFAAIVYPVDGGTV